MSKTCPGRQWQKKKTKVQRNEVILNDQILFPEGGGQPDDKGTINDIPVLCITRFGRDAVHFVIAEVTKQIPSF